MVFTELIRWEGLSIGVVAETLTYTFSSSSSQTLGRGEYKWRSHSQPPNCRITWATEELPPNAIPSSCLGFMLLGNMQVLNTFIVISGNSIFRVVEEI